MRKVEPGGMQEVADVARKGAHSRSRHATGSIQRIADERMARGREVNADLMRPSGVDHIRLS